MVSERQLDSFASFEDFRKAAKRRLPRFLYDYVEGGAGDEITLASNVHDLAAYCLTPLALRDVSNVTTDVTVLGTRLSMPVMLGPIGSLGLFWRKGEQEAIQAARRAGISACLSSFSMASPEEVCLSDVPGGSFQLYALKDRERMDSLLERLSSNGTKTLFVTVDTSVSGVRDRDARNGLRRLNRPGPKLVMDMLSHPRWLADMACSLPLQMFLARDWPDAGRNYFEQASFLAGQIDSSFDISALKWLRKTWQGTLVVKGILTPFDARMVADCGADGIVVSNHGGRQLDSVPSTIGALADIVETVGKEVEILVDGGFRRGTDTLKALTAGASAVLLGRTYVYALAAAGSAGLDRMLDSHRTELKAAMALSGMTSVSQCGIHGDGSIKLADEN